MARSLQMRQVIWWSWEEVRFGKGFGLVGFGLLIIGLFGIKVLLLLLTIFFVHRVGSGSEVEAPVKSGSPKF